ncbi:MAG: hypothetical protein WCD28_09825, partial [Nitrososphaeraceae archaeon]
TIIVLVTTDNTITTITLSVRFLFMTLSYDSCYINYQLVLANVLAKGEKRCIAIILVIFLVQVRFHL